MNIKDEVSMVDSSKTEQLAELSAIIRNSSTIDNGIKITIENNSVARRIFKLFKDIYDINLNITVRRRYDLVIILYIYLVLIINIWIFLRICLLWIIIQNIWMFLMNI